MLNKDSSQGTESSTEQNQSANFPSEPPVFTAFAAETQFVEEANTPSQYYYYPETAASSNLYGIGCDIMPWFESSHVSPPLSPLRSFEDTTAIVFPQQPNSPADGQLASDGLPTIDQSDNREASVTTTALPPARETKSSTEISLGSPSSTMDGTDTNAIATASSLSPSAVVSLSSLSLINDITITDTVPSIESSVKQKERWLRKTQRVISSGEEAQSSHAAPLAMTPPQEIEQSDEIHAPSFAEKRRNVGPGWEQEEATTSSVDMLNIFLDLPSKRNILKPSIIKMNCNEDVTKKITSFGIEKGSIFVTGAVGTLSFLQLRQQGKTTSFKGNFDIISFSGTFLLPKGGDWQSTGQLSVSVIVVGADGNVFGGPVDGCLVAASPIQMVGVTFSPMGYKLRRLKTKPKLPQRQLRTTSMNHDCEAQMEEKQR